MGDDEIEDEDPLASLLDGPDDEIIPEHQLPFVRMKLIDDEAEDEPSAVITGPSICFMYVCISDLLRRTCMGRGYQ